MSNNKNSIMPFVILTAFSAFAIFAGMYFSGKLSVKPKPIINGSYFEKAIAIKPFSLIDHNKQTFTAANFKGQWTFIFFGFTNCPGVCKATMTAMNAAFSEFAEQPKLASSTKFVFITVDPARDTPEKLKKYVSYFSTNFIGVTGKMSEITKIATQLGINHNAKPDHSSKKAIGHGGQILLINPKGEWQAVFRPKHNDRKMVFDYHNIRAYNQ